MTGFMRLRGVGAGPESVSAPGDEPGVFVELHDARPMDTGALYRALTEPGEDVTSGIEVTLSDVGGGLELWLALNEPDLVRLAAIGQAADRGPTDLQIRASPSEAEGGQRAVIIDKRHTRIALDWH
jgi:hypothetical protein